MGKKAHPLTDSLAVNIVNTVREPLLVLADDKRVVVANRAFYTTFETTQGDTEGRSLYTLGDGQWDIPRLRELLEEILPQERFFEGLEVEHHFPGIGWRVMLLNARYLSEQSGLILLAIEDATERVLAKRTMQSYALELERSNKELEQFAYVASHDLQEPLRMVTSYCQLLQRRYAGRLDSDADEFIGFMVDGASRMQRLINDLLTYSRIGRERAREDVDLAQVLARALRNLELPIQESGATITHDPLPTVSADPEKMTQLLQNLISNAIKFRSSAPPRVHVSAKRRENDWLISVQDNGIGIDPQFFERVFIIFQRLHGRNDYEGTGIGLAICKKIVNQHGGDIWIESNPEGGSTFLLNLPSEDTP